MDPPIERIYTAPESVPRSDPLDDDRWLDSLRRAFRSAGELCQSLGLPAELARRAGHGHESFPVFVPREFAARMTPGDADDPLLRQVLPGTAEASDLESLATGIDGGLADSICRETIEPDDAGLADDPVGDRQAVVRPGLLHKYHGRSLLITTGACAVHCRYCFRRHFPYHSAPPRPSTWDAAVEYLSEHPEIDEVLLSGGDPLMLTDVTLGRLVDRLSAIAHLRRLRIHTRVPIMIPSRVQRRLIGWLTATRLTPVMVVHVNHPREIDADVAAALGQLVDHGVPLLNQAVLLRGVNDSVEVLAELCRSLVDLRVMPYYLHQLDRVRGARHFEVPEREGVQLVDRLRQLLPGYAVPRYVRERSGASSKEPLG